MLLYQPMSKYAEDLKMNYKRLVNGHLLYQDGDFDAPPQIQDRNGAIVLGMCKVCGAVESELDDRQCSPNVQFDRSPDSAIDRAKRLRLQKTYGGNPVTSDDLRPTARERNRPTIVRKEKSRGATIALCFFFGGIGAHRFYLGDFGRGILMLLFCWTFIPAVISLFELFYFIAIRDSWFHEAYDYDRR